MYKKIFFTFSMITLGFAGCAPSADNQQYIEFAQKTGNYLLEIANYNNAYFYKDSDGLILNENNPSSLEFISLYLANFHNTPMRIYDSSTIIYDVSYDTIKLDTSLLNNKTKVEGFYYYPNNDNNEIYQYNFNTKEVLQQSFNYKYIDPSITTNLTVGIPGELNFTSYSVLDKEHTLNKNATLNLFVETEFVGEPINPEKENIDFVIHNEGNKSSYSKTISKLSESTKINYKYEVEFTFFESGVYIIDALVFHNKNSSLTKDFYIITVM